MARHANQETNALILMRRFYEIFPYPGRPFFVRPKAEFNLTSHAAFSHWTHSLPHRAREVWAMQKYSSVTLANLLVRSRILNEFETEYSTDKKILLAGCGTDEPLLFKVLHPNHQIIGIDLSRRSLRLARLKLKWNSLFQFFGKNKSSMRLLEGDVTEVLNQEKLGHFDHIQCFGVLHHQPNPKAMLQSLSDSLSVGGTLRLMIYSETGRRLERRIQNRFQNLWKSQSRFKFSLLAKVLGNFFVLRFWHLANFILQRSALRNRFRYIGMNGAALADAFMHPSDPGVSPTDVVHWAIEMGLKLSFCEAKIENEGRIAGFQDAHLQFENIARAEKSGQLLSNVVLIFTSPKKNRNQSE